MPAKVTLEKAQNWIDSKNPKYKIVYWPNKGSGKCIILDTDRNVEFKITYFCFKNKLTKYPDRIFGATTEERSEQNKKASLKFFGVEHRFQSSKIQDKRRKTMIERHGVEYTAQSDTLRKKMKETCLKKFGCEYSFCDETIREKIKQTNLKQFGCENPFGNKIIQEKIKQTNLQRLGYENPFSSDLVKQKIKQTNLQRLGYENPMQNEEIKNKAKKVRIKNGSIALLDGKLVKDWASEKGYSESYIRYRFKLTKNNKSISDLPVKENQIYTSLEFIVAGFLKSNNIEFVHNRKIPNSNRNFRPDFRLEKYKLIIECYGDYWHSEKFESKESHIERQTFYESLGYKFLVFWEREILNDFESIKNKIISNIDN